MSAEYFDGISSKAILVGLSFTSTKLQITGEGITVDWPISDIRYAAGETNPPVSLRNSNAAFAHARLVISDNSDLTAIKALCPELTGATEKSAGRKRTALISIFAAIGLTLSVVGAIHFLPGAIAAIIPVSWEEELGDQVVKDVAGLSGLISSGTTKICSAPTGNAALTRMSNRLLAQTRSPYQFKTLVMDIDMVNAFAAPGGRIVIFKKLLTDAKSPEEAAGVLAHEIAHAVEQHPMKSVARSMGISLIAEYMLGGLGGGLAGTAGEVLLGSAYSRDAEREADRVGLEILRKAKISSRGFFDFFDRLAKEQGDVENALTLIASHPPSDERAAAAKLPDPPGTTPALTPSEWKALQKICD